MKVATPPTADAKPCRDYDPNFKLYGCELAAGHDGPHRDMRGNEWDEHLDPEPERCGSHAPWGSGYPDQRCVHGAGHDGVHRDRSGNEWGETAAEGRPAERAAETFTCCETPMPWPARTEDRTCPECGTVWEHDGAGLGAGARIKPEGAPAAGRPYWLPGPCPAWCAYPEDHQPHDHPDDRVHLGHTSDITLTLVDPVVSLPRDRPGKIEVSIPHLDIYLQQGWREHEPRVELGVNDEPGISLTLAEAQELAEALAGLVRQAAGLPS